MYLGSHVSFDSKEQLLKSVKECISYGANTFMFYTGAPQNTMRSAINDELTYKAYELMKENNINLEKVICHAPYIVNLANDLDPSKYDFSINFLKNEVSRLETLGIKYLVLHPGSSVGIEKYHALDNIINGLNNILYQNCNVVILLETMSGKGTELGTNLEEIKYIIDNIKEKNNIGVCLDTCHLNDSGIDISKFDDYLDLFDKEIGIDKIKCIHINDSKNNIGDHKDRHENFGFGTIGFDNLINIIYNPRLNNIPKILETPYVGENKEYPPYKFEIEMIKNKEFNSNLINDIINYYK
ncbi:MAG: deoxyribonuclease IV [Bacilli bacterium]|nr:deoxyribonuclease IV [Bacilli bacterium]